MKMRREKEGKKIAFVCALHRHSFTHKHTHARPDHWLFVWKSNFINKAHGEGDSNETNKQTNKKKIKKNARDEKECEEKHEKSKIK